MQFVSELAAAAAASAGVSDYHVRLAVEESHLINLLKDQEGIVVCGNVPGAEVQQRQSYTDSRGQCLLMVLQKMPRDEQGMDAETDRYAVLQRLMAAIVTLLTEGLEQFCDRMTLTADPLRVEWEYNAYGGFNGLSLSFYLHDNGGADIAGDEP